MRANQRNCTIKSYDQPDTIRKQNLSKTFTPSILSLKKPEKQPRSRKLSIFSGLDWDVIFHGPETRNTKKLLNKATSVPKKLIISPKDLTSLHMVFTLDKTPSRSAHISPRDQMGKFSQETLKTTNASHDLSSETHLDLQNTYFSTAKSSLEQIRAEARQCFDNSMSIMNNSRKKLKYSSMLSDNRKGKNVIPVDIQKEILNELNISIQILNDRLKNNEKAVCETDRENDVLKMEVENLKIKIAKYKEQDVDLEVKKDKKGSECLIKCQII
ncbi:hypothetical protein SteCoe_18243 [Stentor coeruleus]|uniref:Uncharacterized protein n=1 Tax=Stentor coeruleus TaxID=5963 RepID=A0A1R2BX12_9CILI|nr:hypothetical protein SteCoe_18243 [Stentor coeruleus]